MIAFIFLERISGLVCSQADHSHIPCLAGSGHGDGDSVPDVAHAEVEVGLIAAIALPAH